jgi:hypothetical protein
MDFSRLHRAEALGIVGALVMIASLALLDWYSLGSTPIRETGDASAFICGTGNFECTGWATFPIMRWLLLAAAAAPLILAWIVVRGHKLSWPPGEVTMIVGFTSVVLIAYNGIVDKPSPNDIQISLSYGYFVALLASLGIFLAGGFRAVESGGGAPRKPPATF